MEDEHYGHKFYFRKAKQGIKVELFYNGVMHRILLIIAEGDEAGGYGHYLYITPNRAKNLISLLQEALEHMPAKDDGEQ